MTKTTLRMLPTGQGKRVPIRLDDPTWQAVELLADKSASSWQDWCKAVLTSVPEGENMVAAIREAAMRELLERTLFSGERAEQLALMEQHPLMKNSAVLDDDDFDRIMKGSAVEGWSDFGGFAIGFGYDEQDQECVWVRNGLRGGSHFMMLMPDEVTE